MTDDAGADRTARLRNAVAALKIRRGGGSGERWLMIAGAVLVVVGIPVILLGWWGAARTPYVFEQIPYLISGGMLGLALAIVGGLAYFAYWLTRQVKETRRQTDATEASLRRIEELLGAATFGEPGARAPSKSRGNGSFVATQKGTMFHRADCTVVSGRADVHVVDPAAPGLEPCRICDPLGISA